MCNIPFPSGEKIVVSPSLLAADFTRLKEEVSAAENAGAQALHLDVMDGHFVPNISFGVPVVKSLRKVSNLYFDTHLMISHPLQYIRAFADAGSDLITFHLECDDDADAVIAECRKLGVAVGISVKPGTPAEAVFPYLDKVDLVLVMTVEPGFGGQSFMRDQVAKIADISAEILRRELPAVIEVDGGIDKNTAPEVVAAGASWLVAGTAVFRHKDGINAAVAELKNS